MPEIQEIRGPNSGAASDRHQGDAVQIDRLVSQPEAKGRVGVWAIARQEVASTDAEQRDLSNGDGGHSPLGREATAQAQEFRVSWDVPLGRRTELRGENPDEDRHLARNEKGGSRRENEGF